MRLLLAIIACAVALTVALAWSPAPARADGDPASDVLTTQPLFLPQDAGIPATQQAQLEALVQTASRTGYQIRVALIASPTDLGSITPLWRHPASYAQFLGTELSLTYRGVLLVIMPTGFGVFDQGHPVSAEQAALSGVPLHARGAGLGSTALLAIRQLANAAGHPLPVPHVQAPSATGSTNPVPLIVFALGLVLIALAWTASLRARPLRAGPKSLAVSDP